MLKPNTRYKELRDTYLFNTIYRKTNEYLEANPDKNVLRMGVGDVSLPLCDAVIKALHKAVDDQANAATFHGYMPEIGDASLRRVIEGYYKKMGTTVTENEIFVSSGACDDLGDILELFGQDNTVMVIEPAYPEYVDTNILAGRKIIHLASGEENGFCPNRAKRQKRTSSIYARRIILLVLCLIVISCRLGWILPMRSVPLSCLMRRMRSSLRRRTFRTAFMSWTVPTSALSKSVHSQKQRDLPARVLAIPLFLTILFAAV